MAIANSDGSIVLGIKLATQSVEKGIRDLKAKLEKVGQEKNAFSVLAQRTKEFQERLKQAQKEYALLLSQEKELAGDADYEEKLKRVNGQIGYYTQAIKQNKEAITTLGKKSTKSFDDMSKGLQQFGKRVAGIIKSALIFSVLYKVMQAVVKMFQNILMSDEEFRQDWEELKAAFYAAAYPIINLIVPAIKFIVQQVRDWAVSIGKVAAALQGMSYSELVDQAKASKEAADNYSDMEKSSKKTADNVKKQLAGFDDIQILSSGNEEEQGAGLAGFENLKEYDTSGEKSVLRDLMTAIGGALAAVGLILLFKGQIGWGIGFLAAGAAFWSIGEIWGEDYDPNFATDILSNIMETIGISLAAIGIILITHGQLAWGIGFVIAGAVAGLFGVSIATLTDESVSQKAKDELSSGMMIVGIVAVVLGILLCMAQQWVWGIGLIATGVASIVTPLALNWDGIKKQLQGSFGGWLVLGGIIAIVLGILLCFAQMWALGIGLIVLGAAAVVAPIVANWDAIWDAITGTFNAVIDWIKTYGLLVLGIILCLTGVGIPFGIALIIKWVKDGSEAGVPLANKIKEKAEEVWNAVKEWIMTYGMLVLGILLCLTGVGIPFGIALIIKWAKDGAENGVPLATAIVDKVKEIWASIKAFWDKNIAPVFTAKFWLDLAKNCGNGLIGGFESAINGIITMFENMINWVVDGINSIGFDIPDWLGGGHFGFNIPRASFGRVSIPRLAQGAVIPPNREFLAVLGDQKQGTNIEAPLQTIVDAFNIALAQNGGHNGGGNTEVILEIDGREFGRAVVEQGNRESRRVGTRLVIA